MQWQERSPQKHNTPHVQKPRYKTETRYKPQSKELEATEELKVKEIIAPSKRSSKITSAAAKRTSVDSRSSSTATRSGGAAMVTEEPNSVTVAATATRLKLEWGSSSLKSLRPLHGHGLTRSSDAGGTRAGARTAPAACAKLAAEYRQPILQWRQNL